MANESGGEKKIEGSGAKSSGVIKGIALYGVAMVFMTAVAFFLVTKLSNQSTATTPTRQSSKAERPSDNADDYEEEDYNDDFIGPEYDFEDLVVNPQGTNGTRFLKVRIIAILRASSVNGEIDARKTQLKHQLISIINSKTVEDIDTPEGKEILQKDIVKGLNSILGRGKVRQVYFTDFVIQ